MKITIKRKNQKKRQTTYRNSRQFTEAFSLGYEKGFREGYNAKRDEIKEILFRMKS